MSLKDYGVTGNKEIYVYNFFFEILNTKKTLLRYTGTEYILKYCSNSPMDKYNRKIIYIKTWTPQ